MMIREALAEALQQALESARRVGALDLQELPAIQLDVPPSPELGDFSTDIGLVVARQTRRSPAEVAALLASHLDVPGGLAERIEVGGAGFLNFYLRPDWMLQAVRRAREQGEAFGRCPDLGAGKTVQVEFVSAYPTGPLTVTHGRGAALGDTLARVLEWNGYRVSREFYVNDAGSHMERFGRSLEAHYLRAAGQETARPPVDVFPAPFLLEMARSIRETEGDRLLQAPPEERLDAITHAGRETVVRIQQETLARMGVRFDQWYSEQELYRSGRLEEVLETLRRTGDAYEADGALWLRATRYGDDEDRPLLRSNGQPTYLAGDLAYHLDKFRRGFDRVIDVWGADHQGYIRRTRAGIQALGGDPGALEVLIFAPVVLKLDGMLVDAAGPMGNNHSLREVLDEVGGDVARFFYLTKPAGSPLEYDLDLARRNTPENPLRRVEMARSRARELLHGGSAAADADLAGLQGEAEHALMRAIAGFPDEVRAAARERDPFRLIRCAVRTAEAFTAFDGAGGGAGPSSAARLALVEATAIVLTNVFTVLGLSATAEGGTGDP